MSEFKGTPGPWEFEEDDGDGNQIVVGDNGDVICIIGSYMTSVEEDFANGPLIAAAPELLEALQEVVTAMRQYEMEVDESAPYKHRMMMEKAELALSKARGQ